MCLIENTSHPQQRGPLDDHVIAGLGIAAAIVIGQADLGEAHLVQRLEFPRIGDAILIGILPDAEFAPGGIGGGQLAVAIRVEDQLSAGIAGLGDRFHIGHAGIAPQRQDQFLRLVDLAVARAARAIRVQVQHQQRILGIGPADPLAEAVAIHIEPRRAGEADIKAIAAKVKDDGAGGGCLAA